VILYLDARRESRDAIADELGSDLAVEWVPAPAALDAVLAERGDVVDVVVVGSSVAFDDGVRVAERLTVDHPDIGVIVLTPTIGTQELRRALRAGVLDVLDDERTEGELRDAVERATTRRAQLLHDEEPEHTGRIVLVFSTKGGCGTSVIASNLAVALAERSSGGVGLVDLALSSGDLAIMLQLLPAWSVHDAALQGPRLDREALQGYLTRHEQSGVSLLAAPTDPAAAEQVTAESVQHLLTLMRTLFPVTIVDTPSYFSDQLLAAIDVADEIVVVSSLDVPSVKNLKIALQTLEILHVGRDRIRIVLNRSDSAVGLRATEVERSLGTRVDVQVPSSRDVPVSVNQGTPIWLSKRRSSVANAIDELAGDMAARLGIGAVHDEDNQRRRRLRRR
jgi:pilus assembly protein CpaE